MQISESRFYSEALADGRPGFLEADAGRQMLGCAEPASRPAEVQAGVFDAEKVELSVDSDKVRQRAVDRPSIRTAVDGDLAISL